LPGALGIGFFSKKIEKQPLPTAFAKGSRHRIFSKKNRKTVFVEGLCQERSTQGFFKKKK
jgi:hypothetical protein